MVSGSFHSPARGPFHLSLTVLVRYRSSVSIQPWRMVPPSSDRISPVPPYLILRGRLRVRGSHPLRPGFPTCSTDSHGLGQSPFARHYSGNNYCYLFLPVLRCFSSRGSRFRCIPSVCRVAPFGHPWIKTRLQFPTAFRSLPRPSSSSEA